MKEITISEKNNGEIIIRAKEELPPVNEFIIKSLAAIQMLCLKPNLDPKFKELINILDKSMEDIHSLYNINQGEELNEFFNEY